MGLIGAALAGGVQGLGEGAAKVGQAWNESTLKDDENAAQALRAESLARLNNDASMARTNVTEAGATGRTNLTEAGAKERLGISEAGQNTRQGVTEAGADRRQGVTEAGADRRLGVTEAGQNTRQGAQIASNEKIAQANQANAMRIAQLGGTVQQDKEGNVIVIGRDNQTHQLMDPNNPGQPLKGFKDLTPAAKAFSDVLKAQLVDLDRAEANSMGDQNQIASIGQRRAVLNSQLLNVLTIGTDAMKAQPAATGAPAVGAVVEGYKFKGGDPKDKNNWEKPGGIVGSRTPAPATAAPLTFPNADTQKEIDGLQKRWQSGSEPDKVVIGRRIAELQGKLAQ